MDPRETAPAIARRPVPAGPPCVDSSNPLAASPRPLVLGLVAAGGAAHADDDDDEIDAGTDGDDDTDEDSDPDEDDEDDDPPDAGHAPGGDAGGQGEALPGAGLVGALVDVDQHVFCTAALLTPDALLTAAHCVAQGGVVRWPWGFFVGADVTLGGELVRVIDGAVHPAYDDFLHTADLAVLRVAGGGPRGALARDDAFPDEGTAVRAIGFRAGAVGPGARDAEVSSVAGIGVQGGCAAAGDRSPPAWLLSLASLAWLLALARPRRARLPARPLENPAIRTKEIRDEPNLLSRSEAVGTSVTVGGGYSCRCL